MSCTRLYTVSALFVALLVVTDFRPGNAKRTLARRLRGRQTPPMPRNVLAESDFRTNRDYKNERKLDESFPPCTYYFPTKKSKFNKYDDDWYDPCKTEDSDRYRTQLPSSLPTDSSEYEPRTRFPSRFFAAPREPVEPTSTNDWNDPTLEIIAAEIAPRPVASPPASAPKPSPNFTPSPVSKPSNAPVVSPVPKPSEAPVESEETTIEVQVAGDGTKEEEASCVAAQSGQVIPTSINFTIYYQYELLAERKANMTGVLWPEIDRAFQRFLAKKLIECEADDESGDAKPTFATRLKSVSPQPIDSFGTLYPTGWSSNSSVASNTTACSYIVLDDKLLSEKDLYCDVVTGSVTIYLSEVTYMDAASNPYILFLDYGKDVIQFLRDEINEGGDEITKFLDDSLGVRGFYFISESPSSNINNLASSNGANRGTASATTAIAASLAVFTVFAVATAGFVLRQKKQHLKESDASLKQVKTPRTADDRDFYSPPEFYGAEISDDENSIDHNLTERCAKTSKQIFFQSEGKGVNHPQTSALSLSDENNRRSKSLDNSQTCISVHLESSDAFMGKHNRTSEQFSPMLTGYNALSSRPDPSVDESVRYCQREEQYPHDEYSEEYDDPQDDIDLSTTSSSVSNESSKGNESKENLYALPWFSAPKPSTIGSAALDYILSFGSSILSPPYQQSDESEASNNIQTTPNQEALQTGESPRSRMAQVTVINPETDSSPIRHSSPNSMINWSMIKTPQALTPAAKDSQYLNESTQSLNQQKTNRSSRSSSEKGNKRYLEYSKSRRQSLQSRAKNYRRTLSESPASSWPASREFSRSVSLYKNSGHSSSSHHSSWTDPTLSEGTPSTARAAQILSVSTPLISDRTRQNSSSEPSPEKRRSRVSKAPRIRKSYTSLNDIEDILDIEESSRVASTLKSDYDQNGEMFLSLESDEERQEVDHFSPYGSENFSPYGSEPTSKPTRSQSNTVML